MKGIGRLMRIDTLRPCPLILSYEFMDPTGVDVGRDDPERFQRGCLRLRRLHDLLRPIPRLFALDGFGYLLHHRPHLARVASVDLLGNQHGGETRVFRDLGLV